MVPIFCYQNKWVRADYS